MYVKHYYPHTYYLSENKYRKPNNGATMFIDREKEIARLQQALQHEDARLIVVYGRRRCGKTTLLRQVLPKNAVYFAADLREPPLQITALAKQIDKRIPGFSKPVYPDWESILNNLNLAFRDRIRPISFRPMGRALSQSHSFHDV
jgi:AAA+ ATPase superfamily predicted ATPase